MKKSFDAMSKKYKEDVYIKLPKGCSIKSNQLLYALRKSTSFIAIEKERMIRSFSTMKPQQIEEIYKIFREESIKRGKLLNNPSNLKSIGKSQKRHEQIWKEIVDKLNQEKAFRKSFIRTINFKKVGFAFVFSVLLYFVLAINKVASEISLFASVLITLEVFSANIREKTIFIVKKIFTKLLSIINNKNAVTHYVAEEMQKASEEIQNMSEDELGKMIDDWSLSEMREAERLLNEKGSVDCLYSINYDGKFYSGKLESIDGYTFKVAGPCGSMAEILKILDRISQAASLQHDKFYFIKNINFQPEKIKTTFETRTFVPTGNLSDYSDIDKIPQNVSEELQDLSDALKNV